MLRHMIWGWKVGDIVSFGAAAGFLIFLAWATRRGSNMFAKAKKPPSPKTIRSTHIVVLVALITGFLCAIASVIWHLAQER